MKHYHIHRFTLLMSIYLLCPLLSLTVIGQSLPTHKVVSTDSLFIYLKPEIRQSLEKNGTISKAKLAQYFRDKFAERYFFDWKNVDSRMSQYNAIYEQETFHRKRAQDHMDKFADSTQWVLPFDYLNGNEVNAYALRHLARQHKMVDVAFEYFNSGKDPKYIRYFTTQMRSLNYALINGVYEKIKDGNGVFEAFRSGYRILNWLEIHNLFLGEEAYNDEDQLVTIATLLQHASHMYNKNDSFNYGNHQTRGVSALAMLSILLSDFEDSDHWYRRGMLRLEEHLSKEVNPDGFQFERSVHYHMSDIGTFFYVYQLAKISKIAVDPVWEQKLNSLFSTLVKIAYPDTSAPVLQDDTEIPMSETNDISGSLTLGYLLFEDPEFGHFAKKQVSSNKYWFLRQSQLKSLENINTKLPKYGSLELPDTKYYVMREGWDRDDYMMIISAGLDPDKPDHQHGDMLGVQAMANQQVILPNYQVRYPYQDFDFFKNSMVKNVALVDNELQGKQWTGNRGGSGFGKFKSLPTPTTINWQTNEKFDLFVGSHDGFENIGVKYTRQVIYIKDAFWIVKDNFTSDDLHTYKQVWQGHYTNTNAGKVIRSNFSNGGGCDILQLTSVSNAEKNGTRGKEWTVVSSDKSEDFTFVTAIIPYKSHRLRVDDNLDIKYLQDWQLNQSDWNVIGKNPITLSKKAEDYFFNISKITLDDLIIEFSKSSDVFVKLKEGKLSLTLLSDSPVKVVSKGIKSSTITIEDSKVKNNKSYLLKPGEKFTAKVL